MTATAKVRDGRRDNGPTRSDGRVALLSGSGLSGSGLSGSVPLAHPVPDAEREEPEDGGAPTEVVEVLSVQSGREVSGFGWRRVHLGATCSTAPLAAPSHGGPLRREPVAVSEDPARQHPIDHKPRRGVGVRTIGQRWRSGTEWTPVGAWGTSKGIAS